MTVALVLALWLPSILLVVARRQGGRLRFEVVIVLCRGLVALGYPEAARRVYASAIRRAERGMRALAGRVR